MTRRYGRSTARAAHRGLGAERGAQLEAQRAQEAHLTRQLLFAEALARIESEGDGHVGRGLRADVVEAEEIEGTLAALDRERAVGTPRITRAGIADGRADGRAGGRAARGVHAAGSERMKATPQQSHSKPVAWLR